ncbi:hypothetical protein [Bacillus cereus]|nr:hypothetical protein [Bacillus cereus]
MIYIVAAEPRELDKLMKIIANTIDSKQLRMMKDLGYEVTQEMAFSEVLAIYDEMNKAGISTEIKGGFLEIQFTL